MARPTSYRKEFAEQVKKLAMLGLTDEQLATYFDVGVVTIRNWKAKYPEFLSALKDGKDHADAEVARSLYQRATGYSHEAVKIFNDQGSPLLVPYIERYPPDTTACIFWLKNRRPKEWRDRQEHTGSDGGPLEITVTVVGDRHAKS